MSEMIDTNIHNVYLQELADLFSISTNTLCDVLHMNADSRY